MLKKSEGKQEIGVWSTAVDLLAASGCPRVSPRQLEGGTLVVAVIFADVVIGVQTASSMLLGSRALHDQNVFFGAYPCVCFCITLRGCCHRPSFFLFGNLSWFGKSSH